MEFKDRLKQLRQQKGITQEMLGRAIYVSRSAIAKWEAGLGVPSEDSLNALCAYFSIPKTYLFPNATMEAVLVEKNVQIKNGQRRSIILGIIVFMLSVICLGWGVLKGIEYVRHTREVEMMKTLVPSVQKLYFENPTMVNVEKEVPILDGKYILEDNKWTKLYFEMDADSRISNGWHDFSIEIAGFEVIGLQVMSTREIEANTIRRFRCAVYIRPLSMVISEVQLKSAEYSYMIDGAVWTVNCQNVSQALPISIAVEE